MKKLLVVLFLGIFLMSFMFAQPPFTQVQQFPQGYIIVESQHEYLKQNQDYQYNFFVYNSSNGVLMDDTHMNCTFFLADSSGEVIFSSEVDYFPDGHWGIDIEGANFSEIGYYPYGVSCQDKFGGALAGIFEVTSSGKNNTVYKVLAYIILLLFFFSVIFGFYYTTRNINYEKWNENIINKYESRNIVRVILSSIGYNIMKNSFIWYYLFGLPILLLITDITYVFGVESMIYLMQIILGIYYFGILIVAVFFFGYIQEWFAYIRDEIKSLDDGI